MAYQRVTNKTCNPEVKPTNRYFTTNRYKTTQERSILEYYKTRQEKMSIYISLFTHVYIKIFTKKANVSVNKHHIDTDIGDTCISGK